MHTIEINLPDVKEIAKQKVDLQIGRVLVESMRIIDINLTAVKEMILDCKAKI